MNDNCVVLIVINQDTSISIIKNIITKADKKKVLLLTTHYLYQHERDRINALNPGNIIISTFADYSTDEEMEECDDYASKYLLKNNIDDVSINYAKKFMAYSLYSKNKIIHNKLSEIHPIEITYHDSGLGISNKY